MSKPKKIQKFSFDLEMKMRHFWLVLNTVPDLLVKKFTEHLYNFLVVLNNKCWAETLTSICWAGGRNTLAASKKGSWLLQVVSFDSFNKLSSSCDSWQKDKSDLNFSNSSQIFALCNICILCGQRQKVAQEDLQK